MSERTPKPHTQAADPDAASHRSRQRLTAAVLAVRDAVESFPGGDCIHRHGVQIEELDEFLLAGLLAS